jgi:hypothetical protein
MQDTFSGMESCFIQEHASFTIHKELFFFFSSFFFSYDSHEPFITIFLDGGWDD